MNIFLVSFSGAFMEYKTQSVRSNPNKLYYIPDKQRKKGCLCPLPGAVMEYNTVG